MTDRIGFQSAGAVRKNRPAREIVTEDSRTVETFQALCQALNDLAAGSDCDLLDTYVVELLSEAQQNGSLRYQIGIRKADRVA